MLNIYKIIPWYIKGKINEYKLRHLKLGRLISSDRDNPNHGYRIKGTARDVH